MRYGVVLRAINVGRHNRVRMDVLREAVEAAGFGDVRSYLQTGNLTLDADEPDGLAVADRIEIALAALGLRGSSATVRAWPDLARLAATTPFAGHDTRQQRLTVTLCSLDLPEPLSSPWTERGVTLLGGTSWAVFAVSPWDSARAPSPNELIERRWGIPATTRYWHVITDWVARETALAD